MKNTVSLLLALAQLAAVGFALDTRANEDVECYNVDFDEADVVAFMFNSHVVCAEECFNASQPVFAVQQSACVCLDSLPSDDKKADDAAECNESCPGYMRQICGGRVTYGPNPGYYSIGKVSAFGFGTSNTTNTTSTPSESATTATASATTTSIPIGLPSNSTSSSTPPSSSASGTSASSSPTVDASSAAAPAFGASVTVVSSFVCAAAALAALF